MAKIPVILARPDSSCGKVFHRDRRGADEHRIVLEVWNRATGKNRDGYRLAVFQCMRCGGFHVGQRRADRTVVRTDEFSRPALDQGLLQQALGYMGDQEPTDNYGPEAEFEPSGPFEPLPVEHDASAIARTIGA